METTEFAHLGSVYRTNADASVIEAIHQALSRLARNTM